MERTEERNQDPGAIQQVNHLRDLLWRTPAETSRIIFYRYRHKSGLEAFADLLSGTIDAVLPGPFGIDINMLEQQNEPPGLEVRWLDQNGALLHTVNYHPVAQGVEDRCLGPAYRAAERAGAELALCIESKQGPVWADYWRPGAKPSAHPFRDQPDSEAAQARALLLSNGWHVEESPNQMSISIAHRPRRQWWNFLLAPVGIAIAAFTVWGLIPLVISSPILLLLAFVFKPKSTWATLKKWMIAAAKLLLWPITGLLFPAKCQLRFQVEPDQLTVTKSIRWVMNEETTIRRNDVVITSYAPVNHTLIPTETDSGRPRFGLKIIGAGDSYLLPEPPGLVPGALWDQETSFAIGKSVAYLLANPLGR